MNNHNHNQNKINNIHLTFDPLVPRLIDSILKWVVEKYGLTIMTSVQAAMIPLSLTNRTSAPLLLVSGGVDGYRSVS